MGLRLATGPVSWGVDFADDPHNPPWEEVLDGIEATGLGLTELGPLGYLPSDAEALRPELERRGLAVAGSFVFQGFDDPARRRAVLDATCATCELIAGVGGTHVVLIQAVTPERAATAGDAERAPRLTPERRAELADGLQAAATIATDDFGLRPVLHNHAGSALEFEDELEGVLDLLPSASLGLCLDTGHAFYAGMDLAALLDRWGERVDYLHLKDVRPAVRDASVRDGSGFWEAIADGVFCPLGEGGVDFELLLERANQLGFNGPVTIEQDRRPGVASTPEEDVAASVRFLEGLGMTGDAARPCAIVTGGSSGIGAATAVALAERGFDVAITWAGGEERAAEVVGRLEAAGARAAAWQLDLSDPAGAAGVVTSVLDRFGRVDALVNCAGVNRRAELAEETLSEFQRVLTVNLAGPWAMAQAVAPHMVERGSGRIVNVTSVLAFAPLSGGGAYCASKSGLEALTRVLALELAPHGIHVNAVAPGHAATPMNYDEPFDVHATPRPTIPMGRAADPAEIAAAIAFLASGEASYVNGASLLVDGGLLLASGPESMQQAAGLPAKR